MLPTSLRSLSRATVNKLTCVHTCIDGNTLPAQLYTIHLPLISHHSLVWIWLSSFAGDNQRICRKSLQTAQSPWLPDHHRRPEHWRQIHSEPLKKGLHGLYTKRSKLTWAARFTLMREKDVS